MPFNVKRMQDWVVPGIVAGALTMGLSWLIKFVPQINVTLASFDIRSKLVSGLGTNVGDKIAGLVGGITLPNPLLVIVTAIVVVIVGAFAASFLPVLNKTVFGQFASVLFYGSVATTVVLSGFKFGSILSLSTVVLAAYSVIVGWIMSLLYSNVPQLKKNLPPLPK